MYNGILLKLPAFEILGDKWIGHNVYGHPMTLLCYHPNHRFSLETFDAYPVDGFLGYSQFSHLPSRALRIGTCRCLLRFSLFLLPMSS